MRDQWYGDNRDLVKWGVLFELAYDHKAARVLQVGYQRPVQWPGHRPGQWPELEIDGVRHPISETVLRHFRDLHQAAELGPVPLVEVIAAPFENRREYQRVVLAAIGRRPTGESTVVFLDPDTGLAPAHPDMKHVLDSELSEIWAALPPGDVLVFYQHQTNRNGEPWIVPKREQFERALGLEVGQAKVAQSTALAQDVVFFFSVKPASR